MKSLCNSIFLRKGCVIILHLIQINDIKSAISLVFRHHFKYGRRSGVYVFTVKENNLTNLLWNNGIIISLTRFFLQLVSFKWLKSLFFIKLGV